MLHFCVHYPLVFFQNPLKEISSLQNDFFLLFFFGSHVEKKPASINTTDLLVRQPIKMLLNHYLLLKLYLSSCFYILN